jgi:hypothetical protein
MKTIEIKWSTDDVLIRAEYMGLLFITEKQAEEILQNVFHYHDAEVGVNWDVIDAHINNYLDYLNKQR